MEPNQQVVTDAIKTIQENAAIKKDISVSQEVFLKLNRKMLLL